MEVRMRKLENTSLICIDCYSYGAAVSAIKKSMEQIEFEKVLFLTNIPLKLDGIDVIQIDTINSKREYSEFMMKKLYSYISTDYFCVIQSDGYIIDGEQWDDMFYDYDYIGASWIFDSDRQVGNGGSSFRTKRLHKILAEDNLIDVLHPEDQSICIIYKFYLEEKYGIKFAPVELADKYSYELKIPTAPTFSFHGNFHPPYQKTVLIIRQGALGDVIQCEKVMQYFHDKGYRVVLDTLPQFQLLFITHYFKVHPINEVDQRLLKNAKIVNLDMSYESMPKQLHLKTYFEYAGVSEEDYLPYLKPPKLQIGFSLEPANRLFKNYVVIHIDNRPQKSRNIYGIDWEVICSYLKKLGYLPIQVGRDETAIIGNAIKINCTNEHFLNYVVGGADMMIGIDSGVSHIASAFNVPSIVFFGSVNPEYIHPDLSNITVITNHNTEVPICNNVYCWHSVISCEGVPCYIDKDNPPCSHFKTEELIDAINLKHENNTK